MWETFIEKDEERNQCVYIRDSGSPASAKELYKKVAADVASEPKNKMKLKKYLKEAEAICDEKNRQITTATAALATKSKVVKKAKATAKSAPKSVAKTTGKTAPPPLVADDTLLAYAMHFGRDFLFFEKSAKGFDPKNKYCKQVLSEDSAHYIARHWPSKSLKVKASLSEMKMGDWTVTNDQTGDVIEFVSKAFDIVQEKMVDTEGFRAWKTPLFPPCFAAGVRIGTVEEERRMAEVKDRKATFSYPPAMGTKAEKALTAAKKCIDIFRSLPTPRSGGWSVWKKVDLKTLEKYLKDSSLSVCNFDEGLDNARELGDRDEWIAHADFCRADDGENKPLVAFAFHMLKE